MGQRLMPMVMVVAVLGLGCPYPLARAVSEQPFGGECTGDVDCASGLGCRALLRERGVAAGHWGASGVTGPIEASSLCTTSCGAGACAAGSTCVDARGEPVATGDAGFCVPTCVSDADCRHGSRSQVCAPATEGGPSVCQVLTCLSASSSASCDAPNCTRSCPTGFECVRPAGEISFCQRRA